MNLIESKRNQSSELGVGGSNPSARASSLNLRRHPVLSVSEPNRDKKRDTTRPTGGGL